MNDPDYVDHELLEDLRALATDSRWEAPKHVEERVIGAFRTRRRRRNLLTWIPVAGAVAAIGFAFWFGTLTNRTAAPTVEEEADVGFYPLPEAEALPVVENAMVVRVQLPVSSLRLMGVPISEEGSDSSVQAELLLGQDGLARGVRLAE